MTRQRAGRSVESGVALVTVVVVLVAMALIATPFAISMRHLESGALLTFSRTEARAAALSALAAARRHLEDTHPYYDVDTPHFDSASEIAPGNLEQRFADLLPRDPRGSVRSVTIEDEQGKVHLGTASVWLLGNLLGGRSVLTAFADGDATTLALGHTRGFADAGLVLVGGEQVEYSVRREQSLEELRRGFVSANLSRSRALSHPVGTPVLDARVVLLAQRCWHVRPGVWQPYLRVDGLKDLALFAEMVYTVEDLDDVRADLTVHGGPVRWRDPQRLVGAGTDRQRSPQIHVPDGSRFGPGTILRLENSAGQHAWNMVLTAVDWGDHWRLSLLEEHDPRMRPAETIVTTLVREPVNLNSASPRVLAALLTGIGRAPHDGVITTTEAAHLALAIVESNDDIASRAFLRSVQGQIDQGLFAASDIETAARVLDEQGPRRRDFTLEELGGLLIGQRQMRSVRAVGAATARRLAERLAEGQPRSHEDLALLLAVAVGDGLCSAEDRQLILINALDPGDGRLSGGTAPFTYASGGLFSIEAAAIENRKNGRERARLHVRQLLSPGLPGETARLLTSQRDFEAARPSSAASGWASWPSQLSTGPGVARSPPLVPGAGGPRGANRDDGSALANWRDTLELGKASADRANSVAAGRAGPSDADERSWLGPALVRSNLPDTLHFDEGSQGLLGPTPNGYDFASGPLRHDIPELKPSIIGASSGRVVPFTIEFWFELDDVTAETLLFDAGADQLENRIMLLMSGGELVFRVSDTSIADFEAIMPDGRPPPAGEIRYAFDDGLELLADVPYHVVAHVGGARDTLMMLFVDGVPRGQRSFTTRLTEGLGASGFQPGPAIGSDRVRVESTVGFPERGVLRIGREILEYVDKTDDSFNVRAVSSSDPFGGRSRRGTTGQVHEASELVELVGYSRALASVVANKGNGTLDGRLAAFDVAEIDPATALEEIEVEILFITGAGSTVPVPLLIGTGIKGGTGIIPLRSTSGVNLDGVFQAGGGHAIIFCDYGNTALAGQPISQSPGVVGNLPARTSDGDVIGGAEIIRYNSFDGTSLQGCQRGAQGIPLSEGPDASPIEGAPNNYVNGLGTTWDEPRAFVTAFSNEILGSVQGLPEQARVFVIPISVGIDDGTGLYAAYHPQFGDSALVQLGLDFPEGGGGTEWVRWNTPTAEELVRDDPIAIDNMLRVLAGTDLWRMDSPVLASLPDDLNERLEFRGQAGTPNTDHETADEVYPTLLFGAWGVSGAFEPALGIPGRHDATTLVSDRSASGDDVDREWHVINHATNSDPDFSAFTLVGFREPVLGDFAYSAENADESYPLGDLDVDGVLARDGLADRLVEQFELEDRDSLVDLVRRLQADSRQVSRLIKAPSGELPAVPLPSIHFGEDFDHRPSNGGARIDELRISTDQLPGPLLPRHARYRLAEEFFFEEDGALVLSVQELLYPQARVRLSLLGRDGLEILSELPQSGGLLLVGEEIVAYAGLDPVDTGAVFLAGRGLYGTRRAYHAPGEPVLALTFWPVSPLTRRVDQDDSVLAVADPSAFPAGGGLVWVDDELIGYDEVTDEGLLMPVRQGRSLGLQRGFGLLRGRFGTAPGNHAPGTMVRWQPQRCADQALLGEDVPEAHGARLEVRAPGAFFTDLAVTLELPDPLVELDALVVLDDQVSPHADPSASPQLFVVPPAEASPSTRVLGLGAQADLLELYLSARWLPGAFDVRDHASNAWKLGPRVHGVVVGHVQPTIVLSHEEWR